MLNSFRKTKKKIKKYISNQVADKKDDLFSKEFLEIMDSLKKIMKKKLKKNKELDKNLSDFSTSYIFYLYYVKKTIDYFSVSENFINMIGKKTRNHDDIFFQKTQIFIDYSNEIYKTDISQTNWLQRDIVSYNLKNIDNYYKLSNKNNNYIHYKSYFPRYAILLNHNLKSIVIVIRGTKSIIDAIADINCDNIRKFGGYIHSGFYNSSLSLLNEIQDSLLDICSKYKSYSINICGHSYAGSCSIILAVLIKKF